MDWENSSLWGVGINKSKDGCNLGRGFSGNNSGGCGVI